MTKPSYEDELGNFWTERELDVIRDLAGKQELSPAAVLRQGLRLYQLQFQPPQVGRKAAPPLCPSQELSFVGDPMNVEYACFGGLYYTLTHQECVEKLLKAHSGASLARVRGLLQRILKLRGMRLGAQMPWDEIAAEAGAESADIGKLDSADESGRTE